jgi:hypothetical protein
MGDAAGRRHPPRPEYRPMVFERIRKWIRWLGPTVVTSYALYMIGVWFW